MVNASNSCEISLCCVFAFDSSCYIIALLGRGMRDRLLDPPTSEVGPDTLSLVRRLVG